MQRKLLSRLGGSFILKKLYVKTIFEHLERSGTDYGAFMTSPGVQDTHEKILDGIIATFVTWYCYPPPPPIYLKLVGKYQF